MHSLAHALDVDITAFFFQDDEAQMRSALSVKERRMIDDFRRIQSPADQEFVLRLAGLLANA